MRSSWNEEPWRLHCTVGEDTNNHPEMVPLPALPTQAPMELFLSADGCIPSLKESALPRKTSAFSHKHWNVTIIFIQEGFTMNPLSLSFCAAIIKGKVWIRKEGGFL